MKKFKKMCIKLLTLGHNSSMIQAKTRKEQNRFDWFYLVNKLKEAYMMKKIFKLLNEAIKMMNNSRDEFNNFRF